MAVEALGVEVEPYTVAEMRRFMRLHLGDDWEMWLLLANAIADPDAPIAEVHAAQQRAVALVRLNNRGCTDETAELAAEAWLVLWAK